MAFTNRLDEHYTCQCQMTCDGDWMPAPPISGLRHLCSPVPSDTDTVVSWWLAAAVGSRLCRSNFDSEMYASASLGGRLYLRHFCFADRLLGAW